MSASGAMPVIEAMPATKPATRAIPATALKRWGALVSELEQLAKLLASDGSAYQRFFESLHGQDFGGVGESRAEPPALSGEKLLVERAELLGVARHDFWSRREPISLGGACRMLRAADGVIAVNLPRVSDWELVEAWLSLALGNLSLALGDYVGDVSDWEAISELVSKCHVTDLETVGAELGMAVCGVGSFKFPVDWCSAQEVEPTFRGETKRNRKRSRQLDGAKVADMSAMWAGPLCGDLLGRLGAQVIKLESVSRPDGLRQGQPVFYERLNSHKKHLSFDLRNSQGREKLRELLLESDIVISSCRFRALEQLGINPSEVVAASEGIWAAITGYGLYGASRNRVAFGDDAAAAGGLVWEAQIKDGLNQPLPCFIGDALADPTTGVYAAVSILRAWPNSSGAVLDIPMAKVASWLSGQ